MPLNADRNRWAAPVPRKPFIARSRCLVGWWLFSARLFSPLWEHDQPEDHPTRSANVTAPPLEVPFNAVTPATAVAVLPQLEGRERFALLFQCRIAGSKQQGEMPYQISGRLDQKSEDSAPQAYCRPHTREAAVRRLPEPDSRILACQVAS
jgi:hypothetical protein